MQGTGELREAVEAADSEGQSRIEVQGQVYRIDADLRERLCQLLGKPVQASDESRAEAPGANSLGLQIIQNLGDQDQYEGSKHAPLPSLTVEEPPEALNAPNILMPHQRQGVAWLLGNLHRGRSGCLLADDMGLGKSLQILTFLASVLEHDERMDQDGHPERRIVAAGPHADQAPYNPILIVAPVILLENETWQKDMKAFFQGDGGIFMPWVDLRGNELKRLRREGTAGQEIKTGQSHLDVDRLRTFRVVLTNYETVVNYQFSLGQVPWSILVTDEAQEYKTPTTRVAQAIKAMKATFRVAATGTPVETSLEDVWSIFDFLDPSRDMLGTLATFRKEWAKPVEDQLAGGQVADLESLRKKLGVGDPKGHVLRREKTDNVSLPPKTEIVLPCELSEEQIQLHRTVLERARAGGEENHPLSLLHNLMLLTQHPRLIPSYEGGDPKDLVQACPKLKCVLDTLDKVKAKGEKALVFTRSIPMQQILKAVFQWRYGFEAGILNGRSGRQTEPGSGKNTRQQILDRFRFTDRFAVLILSPEVAGLGLTIVEANHVIHYGRWWNPAKELQATDRAYRIGQSKEVFVYYPVASDPQGRFRSIDESLDSLLKRRKELAKEFLRPGCSEDDLTKDLARDLFSGERTQGAGSRRLEERDLEKMDGYGFEALVAALERKSGHGTVLTPAAGDEGIDVLALDQGALRLIQCKHNHTRVPLDREALDDLRRGLEGWSSRRLPPGRDWSLHARLVTSGPVSRGLVQEAREEGIEVWDGQIFRNRFRDLRLTEADWQAASSARAGNLRIAQEQLARL